MFKFAKESATKSKEKEINANSKAEYINVPVQLLAGFLEDTRQSIRSIYFYSIYAHFIKLEKGSVKERYKRTCEYFNFQELDREENLRMGKILYERYTNPPMTGIARNLYTEYNKLEKSDFEKACFLAFHALKSIVGEKIFQKTDNRLLWSRMDGKVKAVRNETELSEKLIFFTKEYQTLKIKKELQENWGLVYYAQQTRGFYISFKLDLKALILEAMKRKRKQIEKQRIDKIRLLEKEVSAELEKKQKSVKSTKTGI